MPVQYRKTLTVSAASSTAVAGSQTPTGTTPLTLAVGAAALPNTGQRPKIVSNGADISNRTFAFVGKDYAGNAITYTQTGPGAGLTVILPVTFYSITSITPSGTAAGSITVGYAAQADLMALPLDTRSSPTDVSLTLQAFTGAGTPQATVRFTQDNIFFIDQGGRPTFNPGTTVWFNHATMVAQTAAATGSFDKPVVACSVFLDGISGTATVDFIVIQGTSGVS